MGTRQILCAGVLAAAACAHHAGGSTEIRVDPNRTIGETHGSYDGMPAYMLAANRPLYPEARPGDQPAPNPCAKRSGSCEARLRAELAGLDGQLLALSDPPTKTQLEALTLTAQNLAPLLAPYPDLMSEQHELVRRIGELPGTTRLQQPEVRRRMLELSDLLRVQLAAGD
jgi:hypothetical protein